ncbi:MAG: ADOP family duplicated permease [Gemmatimonadales bacterium]
MRELFASLVLRFSSWLGRAALFLHRDRATRELEEEMRLHRELRAAALGGADAVTDARQQFGNPLQHAEASRDAWGMGALDDLRQDVRYAMRRLRQRPGFSASVIVVLALGIGATTAMFSAVDAALLRPLPFDRPGQLVVLPSVRMPYQTGPRSPDRVPDLLDITAMRETFSHAAGFAAGGLNLTDPDRPRRLRVGVVTGEFFATMGVTPLHGRGLTASDGVPGAPLVAILSYGLWQERFGGAEVIGRDLDLDGKKYQIIGVMPPYFTFPKRSELWIPMSVPITTATFEAFGMFLSDEYILARVADSVSLPAAEQQVLLRWKQALASAAGSRRSQIQSYIEDFRRYAAIQPLQRVLTGQGREAVLLLFGATGLLLLIACANVINLLLSQAVVRRREVALREVLGATRARLVRQLLTESLLLAGAGALIGLALARSALRLITVLLPENLTAIAPPVLDVSVLVFAVAVAMVIGVGSGVLPAIRTSRVDPGTVIKHGSQGSGRETVGVRLALVVAEVALTTMLLIGTGLMLRSLQRVLDIDRGMDVENVASARIAFARSTPVAIRLQRMTSIAGWLRSQPGISAAGFVNDRPISDAGILMDLTPGQPVVPKRDDDPGAHWLMTSPGYFSAMGIAVLHGRSFADTDDSLAPPVAVISESIAKRYWPGVDPVGRTIQMGNDPSAMVVGVVADVREDATRDPPPQIYMPIAATPPKQVSLLVHGTLPRSALLGRVAAAVRYADPSQALYDVHMMDDVLSTAITPWRTDAVLIALFAGLALLMASFGVYAVVAHAVGQRIREFGIRSALGATPRQLLWLPMHQMSWIIAAGWMVGLAGAWAASRVAASLLYGVSVHDPVTFGIAPLLVAIPAMVATLVPARHAARVNPAEVMRAE